MLLMFRHSLPLIGHRILCPDVSRCFCVFSLSLELVCLAVLLYLICDRWDDLNVALKFVNELKPAGSTMFANVWLLLVVMLTHFEEFPNEHERELPADLLNTIKIVQNIVNC